MTILNAIVRFLFWGVFVRLVVLVILGLNVRRRENLPQKGPAIIAANHNSHLDTLVLMSLYPASKQHHVRPAGAADHFLKTPFMRWLALEIIGMVPIDRTAPKGTDVLKSSREALEAGDILILYPEGSRGEPEEMTTLKTGVARLAENMPNVPVIPVYMHGLGKALPKNEALLVPFFCDVFVGQPLFWQGDKDGFMTTLANQFEALRHEHKPAGWH